MNVEKISLGILGMSEGNGHPYSWSAIFNGYDDKNMASCPFPVIPDYLSQQTFPEDAISDASVTHIYTQDIEVSEHVMKAANIPYTTNSLEELTNAVDAVLLARDDAELHFDWSLPTLKAGKPLYIDKPLAYTVEEANKILGHQCYEGQVFTCSALRYASELQLSPSDRDTIGKIQFITAAVPKDWLKYSVHIIEPVLQLIPDRGSLVEVQRLGHGDINIATVSWTSGVQAVFQVLGNISCPISIHVYGELGHKELVFKDTYAAFKGALEAFVRQIRTGEQEINREETLEIIEIIERATP